MELTFLGRGSAFNPGEGNTSAYLREDGRVLLLDCGETVFGRLIDRGVLADAREVYAVVSHLHSDHCGSLSTLALYCFWRMRQPLTLVTAEDPEYVGQLRRLLGLSGIGEDGVRFLTDRDMPAFRAFESLRIVPTEHVPQLRCFSFVFETEEGGAFYSADTRTTRPLEEFLSSHARVAAIWHEATARSAGNDVHTPIARLDEVIPRELRDRTFLMHLDGPETEREARRRGFACVRVDGDAPQILTDGPY